MDLKEILKGKKTTEPTRNGNTVEKTIENVMEESYLESKLIKSFNDFYANTKGEVKFDDLYNNLLQSLDSIKYNTSNIENDISRLCKIAQSYQYEHNDIGGCWRS